MRRTTLILIATLIAGGTVSAFVPEKGGQQGIYLAKNAGGPPGRKAPCARAVLAPIFRP